MIKGLPAGSGSPEGRLKRPDGCCVPVILLHSLMESHQVKPKLSLLPTAHALPKSNKRQAGELPRTAGKRERFPLRPTLCSPPGALLSGLRPRPATPDCSCPGARARPPVPTHGSAPRDSLPKSPAWEPRAAPAPKGHDAHELLGFWDSNADFGVRLPGEKGGGGLLLIPQPTGEGCTPRQFLTKDEDAAASSPLSSFPLPCDTKAGKVL